MMRFWGAVLKPALDYINPKHIIEIGADVGKSSNRFASWCAQHAAQLDVVDPYPKFSVTEFETRWGSSTKVHIAKSLDVLAELLPADLVVIDGDHNWFTVFNELKTIFNPATLQANIAPVVICHDVSWPYGRRDLYYNLESIPEEFRQPATTGGLHPESKGLCHTGMNSSLCHAEFEGGPRNGVRTAIEDALGPHLDQLRIQSIDLFSGLMLIVPNARLANNMPLQNFLDELAPSPALRLLIRMAEQQRIYGEIAQQQITLLSGQGNDTKPVSKNRPIKSALTDDAWRAIQHGLFEQRYKGRALLMSPFDMANYTQLLGSLKPNTVFEIGTNEGGRALWLADALQALGITPQIITIDLNPPENLDCSCIQAIKGNALTLGDVLNDTTMAALPRPFLVIEDSAHHFATSYAVLDFFHNYLHAGEYIVIEDGNLGHLLGNPEDAAPAEAIEMFLKQHPEEYEIDASLCDRFGYNVTSNPNGWLKRC